jgi:hypothetical protein
MPHFLPDEAAVFRKSAKSFFSLSEAQIEVFIIKEGLVEVHYEE